MRTPREIAHDGVREGMAWCTHDSYDPAFNRHSSACDRLTAALEARDAEHAKALAALNDAYKSLGTSLGAEQHARVQMSRERDEALAALSRQGEGDVVERVLAVECPEFAQCNGSKGRACFPAAGGYPDVFCASRLRASTPTPAPAPTGMEPGQRCVWIREHMGRHFYADNYHDTWKAQEASGAVQANDRCACRDAGKPLNPQQSTGEPTKEGR